MKVLLHGNVAHRGADILAGRFGDRVEVALSDDRDDAGDLAASFAEAEVIVSITYNANLPPAPRLKLLHLPNSGLDAVDIDAVPDGCRVCNCFEHEIGIGEYVMAALLHHSVGLAERSSRFRAGDWSDSPRLIGPFRPELAGKTIATIGYGNIGRAVAARARAFGMGVRAVTRTPRPLEPTPDWLGGMDDIDTLFAGADFVLACCPLTADTTGIVDARRIALMKPEAVLINVGRGPLIDENALYEACRDGRIAGAVIDVWYRYADADSPDVRPSAHPFHELDNVIMTPHLSGWTEGLMPRRFAVIGDNIERLMAGNDLVHQVHP